MASIRRLENSDIGGDPSAREALKREMVINRQANIIGGCEVLVDEKERERMGVH